MAEPIVGKVVQHVDDDAVQQYATYVSDQMVEDPADLPEDLWAALIGWSREYLMWLAPRQPLPSRPREPRQQAWIHDHTNPVA